MSLGKLDSLPGTVSAINSQQKDSHFLDPYLGGKPFKISCTLSFNGKSLSTANALVDSGANGYLFVNMQPGRRLVKYLNVEKKSGFDPRYVGGFNGGDRQIINLALRAHLTVKSSSKVERTILDEWLIVIDCPDELIIGRKWLEAHDVLPDCRRRCLSFPLEWHPNPEFLKKANISVDHWNKGWRHCTAEQLEACDGVAASI